MEAALNFRQQVRYPADLEVSHPDMIAVEIDGYGPGGPLSHKRAYDLLQVALTKLYVAWPRTQRMT
mgnify:CR=1 FL=1